MKYIKHIKLPEISEEEYLNQIKEYLVDAKAEQQSLRQKIDHYTAIINRTNKTRI